MLNSFFSGKKEDFALELPEEFAEWVYSFLENVGYQNQLQRLKSIKEDYEEKLGDFSELAESEVWQILRENGLLIF